MTPPQGIRVLVVATPLAGTMLGDFGADVIENVRLSGPAGAARRAVPALGQHTAEVPAGFGVVPEQVAGLRERGAV